MKVVLCYYRTTEAAVAAAAAPVTVVTMVATRVRTAGVTTVSPRGTTKEAVHGVTKVGVSRAGVSKATTKAGEDR